jgi:hypothetical protein
MNIHFKGKTLGIAGIVLFLVLCILGVVLFNIGGIYKNRLALFSQEQSTAPVTHIEKAKIRKISLQKNGDNGCMEVTPEGVVRLYAACGKELSDARRITDTKYILRLYKQVSEMDSTTFTPIAPVACDGYVLTLDTDQGIKTACVSGSTQGSGGTTGGNGGSGGGGDIIETITLITEDIPPTLTPTRSPLDPTPTPDGTQTPSPTPVAYPSWGSTPTPTPATVQPFTCDFTDSQGKKKPYTVSNIICSTEPVSSP